MTNFNEQNLKVIEDFRSSGGKAGGRFEGRPLLLLTSTGAKSGKQRTNPLMYMQDGDRCVVFASKGGGPTNPDWYHNIVANPTVTLEVGSPSYYHSDVPRAVHQAQGQGRVGYLPALGDIQLPGHATQTTHTQTNKTHFLTG